LSASDRYIIYLLATTTPKFYRNKIAHFSRQLSSKMQFIVTGGHILYFTISPWTSGSVSHKLTRSVTKITIVICPQFLMRCVCRQVPERKRVFHQNQARVDR
jgi:hypothetical protein